MKRTPTGPSTTSTAPAKGRARIRRKARITELSLETTPQGGIVDAILMKPPAPLAGLVLAHGAGAGMRHPFMQQLAECLAAEGVATLRYNFPFIQKGHSSPDLHPILHATVRAAVKEAMQLFRRIPVFAGGKSMGGRMTSQLSAKGELEGIRGIVFVGFPLHPPGERSRYRAEHLRSVPFPMLFLQGTRDSLADITMMRDVCGSLGTKASLHVIDGADHSFHMRKGSARSDAEVMEELARTTRDWMALISDGKAESR